MSYQPQPGIRGKYINISAALAAAVLATELLFVAPLQGQPIQLKPEIRREDKKKGTRSADGKEGSQRQGLEELKARAKQKEASEDINGAIEAWKEAIQELNRDGRLASMEAAEAYRNLAINLFDFGAINDSLTAYTKSLDLLIELGASTELEAGLALMGIGRCYKSIGNPVLAENAFEKAGDIFRKELGEESEMEAINLANLASLKVQLGNLGSAEIIYKRAISIFSAKGGEGNLNVATTKQLLANVYTEQGMLKKAEALNLQALEIYRNKLGQDHSYTATVIGALGGIARGLGEYKRSEELLKTSLSLIERRFGSSHPQTAEALTALGDLYTEAGKSTEAEPLIRRALNIYESDRGSIDNTIPTRSSLAVIRANQARYDEAELLYNESVKEAEMKLGRGSSITKSIRLSLGQLYAETGQFAKATHLYYELQRGEQADSPESAAYQAEIYSAMGNLLSRQGYLGKAYAEFSKSLKVRRELFGELHPKTIESYQQLARSSRDLGLKGESEKLMLTALRASEQVNGERSINNASLLIELASMYNNEGSLDKAKEAGVKSLEIYQETVGVEHPATAIAKMNLANILVSHGSLDTALSMYADSRRVLSKNLGDLNPETIAASAGVASTYLAMNKASEALIEYTKAERQLTEAVGVLSPQSILLARGVVMCYELLGLRLKAIDKLNEVVQRSSLMAQGNASLLPSSFREEFIASIRSETKMSQGYAFVSESGAELALFSRLNGQGMLEEIERKQSLLLRSAKPAQEQAYRLRDTRIQLSNLTISPVARNSLQAEQRRLELSLYRLLPEVEPKVVGIPQIASALASTSVLIEFQKYLPIDSGDSITDERWRYMALTLKANSKVVAIDLGPAAEIEEKIKQALRASEEQLDDAESLWAEVGDLIFDPLASVTSGMQTLFISPDAELNRIPFAALPAPGSQQFLTEISQLRLLTTGRELLDLVQPSPQAKSAPLVVANPDFDHENTRRTNAKSSVSNSEPYGTTLQRSPDLETLHWAPLPATAKEGQIIAELTNARLLTQQQATASAILQQRSPQFLHIASHAFYLPDQPRNNPQAPLLVRSGLDGSGGLRTATLAGESPLLRSGIALAGANRAAFSSAAGVDDGYLTALEVAQLDWSGTELVVISACESGKGDIQAGEGVYGLKRAIAVAGARSSLLSLWKVDDAATAAFMQAFYGRLKAGQPRADALADTQKQFRRHPIPAWRHPYVWAAFQLSGDWRPIRW